MMRRIRAHEFCFGSSFRSVTFSVFRSWMNSGSHLTDGHIQAFFSAHGCVTQLLSHRRCAIVLSTFTGSLCHAKRRIASSVGGEGEDGCHTIKRKPSDSGKMKSDAEDSGAGETQGDEDWPNCSSQGASSDDDAWTSDTGRGIETAASLRTAYSPSAIDLPELTFLKCIEKEMMDEKLRLDKEEGPPPVPGGWEFHHVEGTSIFHGRRLWIPPPTSPYLSREADATLRPPSAERKGCDLFSASAAETTISDEPLQALRDGQVPHKKRRATERHFIRVQLTTRDASLDPECDIRGEHFPFSFFVQRVPSQDEAAGNSAPASAVSPTHAFSFSEDEELSIYHNSIEVRLDVIEGELVVNNLVFHGDYSLRAAGQKRGSAASSETEGPIGSLASGGVDSTQDSRVLYDNPFGGYPGPNLDEAEEELLDGIQSWLAERHIDDQFGEFIGQYSVWIEQVEYERWLQQLHDYVAA